MPSPAVTYTFSNATTADATQVNQNFTDIINGITDGTKDISINALTAAGNANLNGNVTLGNASTDDITVTGSLASSIPIKTTNTYNIGSSTLGLASVYLGANSQTVRILGSASMSATWSFTLPASAGTDGFLLSTNGSGVTSWSTPLSAEFVQNLGLSASVGSSALTIALKTAAGSDASSTDQVRIAFRSATESSGVVSLLSVSAALSTVISSGSTAGHGSNLGSGSYLFIYAINNAGTVELAWSSKLFEDGSIQSTTAEGAAGGADSATALYSTTARSNVAIRLIGRMLSLQTTAGTWAAAPTEIVVGKAASLMPKDIELKFNSGNGFGSDASNKIRRYTNVEINSGNIYYSDSATAGLSVTILVPGIYSMNAVDDNTGGSHWNGFSRNASSTDTALSSLAAAQRLASLRAGASGYHSSIHISKRLDVGDIIRVHQEGKDANGAQPYDSWFNVKWIGW